MAWRPTQYLVEGELDNTRPHKVTGWMQFADMKNKMTFNLEGNFHRDIRGAKIHFQGDAYEGDYPEDAEGYMKSFAEHQTGKVGDMTTGLPPQDYGATPYLEIYSAQNGRIVIELEPVQVEVIGQPIPACESDPISRKEQAENLANFLNGLAKECGIPEKQAIAIGDTESVERAKKIIANDKIRGMKLLPKEIREQLPSLYAQDGKGGKAVAYLKLFTPDSGWYWWITEGQPVLDEQGREIDFEFFALVQGQEREMGYVYLSELETVRGPMGLPIERDLYWRPKTLAEIAPEMFASGEEDRRPA